ncbi:hypothetical protein AB1K70_19560 [Bremerella sp. JC770]|uniref:hypothetical protein n=1 Tax=Bremerella sp. JC770 TaxID=3232137 RepID=UPI00345AF19F
MNPEQADKLLELGERMGVQKRHILRLRTACENDDDLAECILAIKSESNMTNHLVRELLISSFGLSIGDIQILHLWWEDAISDAELNASLRELIVKSADLP